MAVLLSPVGGVAGQFFDNNGNPLTGGKMYSYVAGTTTPQATYTSSAGAVAHSNPIILDAGGRVPGGEIWLTDGLQYKFVLKNANDVLIGTYDNIIGINSNFVNFLTETEVQTATAGQTVFTLTTMQYQPGTNNLTVYVDGVNQIDGSTYSYVETSSTVVTFTAGLHVGALVKFTTAQTLSTGVTDASLVTYDPPFTASVATTVEDKLAQTVSVKDFGAVGDGATDDTVAIQTAIDYGIVNLRNVYFPKGTYLISSTLNFIANSYAIDYPFPRLNQIILTGESGSKIKADAGFTGAMLFMGDSATSTGFKDALFLIGLTIDGGNQEIKLVDALPNWQARFYAERCNFVGVTGANSYAIDSTWSSAWLKDCVLQGSGAYTSNGIGIVANVTTISLDNCFISYFAKAIYYTNFVEATVQAKNCLFQINAANLAFEGAGYLNNTSSYVGCYFVETKPNDVHLKVDDEINFGSWGNLNFYACQFDGYNANAATPLLDFDFGNCSAAITFTGCNVWIASAPVGTFALTLVTIGQYTKVDFVGSSDLFKVVNNNNPRYANFAQWLVTGTAGGTSIAGFNTRELNQVVENGIPSCTLLSNIITLPIGVYKIQASAPCIKGGRHRVILYNNTKNSNAIYGTNNYAAPTDDGGTTAMLSGRLVLNEQCQLRLLHYIETAAITIGLGAAIFDGSPEIYAQIEIWKEA